MIIDIVMSMRDKFIALVNKIKGLVTIKTFSILKYLENSYQVKFIEEQVKQDRDIFRAAEMQAIQYLVSLIRTIARRLYILKHLVRLPLVKAGFIAPPAQASLPPVASSHSVR